jgi:predicted GNAT family N-acyltransferase
MADFMLTGDLDLTPAEKEVRDFQKFLAKVQNEAAASSGNASVVTTPKGTAARLANPQRVAGYNSQDDSKRLAAQRKMIENQAKLVALAETEAKITAKASGKTLSPKDLAGVRAGAVQGLGEFFQLTPAQKGQFTKAVNNQVKKIESSLDGLSGDQLNAAFKELADPILKAVGLTEATVQKLSAVQAKNIEAENEILAANERRAAAATQAAAIEERESGQGRSADQRTNKAKDRQAKAAEGAARTEEKGLTQLKSKYDALNTRLTEAVNRAKSSKSITEKAAAGKEISSILKEQEDLQREFQQRQVKSYSPLNIETSNRDLVEERRKFQERTGKRGTAAGGYGASELTVTGYAPLSAMTEGLKDYGKASVKFLDEATKEVTSFAKFLGSPEMESLMDEFGVVRGKGKNQATYTIQDPSRASEFASRSQALLADQKESYKNAKRLESAIDDTSTYLDNFSKDIQEGRVGKDPTSDKAVAAEAVFTNEILEAKAKLEALGLSSDQVKAALLTLAGSAKAEAVDIQALASRGFVKTNEWVGTKLTPETGVDPLTSALKNTEDEVAIIESIMAQEIAAEKDILASKNKEREANRRSAANAEKKAAIKPDEVIAPPPVAPKTDVVRFNDQDPIDVRSATEAEKRAHVQAYAREKARIAAEGTAGTKPIELGAGEEIRLAKEEEAAAAREAAVIERQATDALARQSAAQQAAEAKTTKAKEAEAVAAAKPDVIPTPAGTGDYVKAQDINLPDAVKAEEALNRFLLEEKEQQVAAEKEVTSAKRRKVRLAEAEATVLKNLLATESNPVGRVVGKDFVYDPAKSEEVQTYFANQKRISDQAGSTFGRGQERLGVASSKILDDANLAIFAAKQEEATAAKIAAKQEENAAEKEQVEQGKQLAAEKKITRLKESYYTDYSSASVAPDTGFIYNVATRSDKRGQGEASKVMRQITDDADALGQKLYLSARDELEGFYNQFGFKKTDEQAFGNPVYEREPLAKAQVAAEEQALADQIEENAQQAAADEATTAAKRQEAEAAQASAKAAKLKFTRDYAKDGATSYSAVSETTGKGYIINKDGPGKDYEIFDEYLRGGQGDYRSQKFGKLQDAKDYIQQLEDDRAATAAAQLKEEQEAAARQQAEDVKQEAADKQITSAKTEQAAAAKKLSAAQARAVNLVADGTAVTKEQLKEAGVKASTVRSLEKQGAITERPDGVLQASDAAIASAKQAQVGAVQRQTAAEVQAATAAEAAAVKEAELLALKEQLKGQIRKGILTVEEANTKFLAAGGEGNFNRMKSAVPVSQIEPPPEETKKERAPRRSRDQIIHDEEGGLIEALRRKIKALNAQSRVLENKLGPFTQAESLLIDALNRKARALQKQINAIESGQVVVASESKQPRKKKETPAPAPAATPPPAPAPTPPAGGGGQIDDAELARLLNESTEATPIGEVKAEEEQSAKERKEAAKAEKDAAKKRKETAKQQIDQAELESAKGVATTELVTSSADAIAAEEAADAARIATATAEERKALEERKNLIERTPKRERQSVAAALASRNYTNTFDILGDETKNNRVEQILAGPSIDTQYFQKERPKGFSAEDSFDEIDAAQELVAQAYREYATLINLTASQYFDEFLDFKAAIAALRTKISGLISLQTLEDPYFGDIVRGKAETTTANTVIGAGVKGELLDSDLTQQYIAAKLENIGLTKTQSAMIARMIANDPAQLEAEAQSIIATNELTAATLRKVRELQGGVPLSQAQLLVERKTNSVMAEAEALNDPQYLEALRQGQINSLISRRAKAGKSEGAFGKLTQALGYDRSGGGSLTEFFGGGALSSLRYGLPSMLLFSAGSGIANTIKEAEELQYNLARLEGQFNATFSGQDFGPVRQEILNVAKDTGLAADEIANLQIQITGAFGTGIKIGGLDGEDLVKSQVESAAKLAQTVGLPLSEITDGLTAASLAFNSSFEKIGDVALSLEEESGVLAKETISFIGDIAPVAKEAGYSLEEFSAIAAVAQQRSGRSGTALAESFGRVIPALTEQKDKLLELSAIEPALANDKFFDAIRQSNPKEILDQIGQAYANMSKEGQQATVNLLGGRREAQAIIPAIANQALVARYVKDAKDSAGTLEERFLKVQETLTNSFQRLGEAFRQLGVELLESGLSDVFDKAITGAKGFLAVLSPIIKLIGTINEGLGGMPLTILLAVGALQVLKRAMTRVPLDPTTGLPAVGVNGQTVARVPRYDIGALRNRETYTPQFVQRYRELRAPTPVVDFSPGMARDPYVNERGTSIPVRAYGPPKPNVRIDPGLGPLAASGKTLAASGKNLLAALGGGSVALGAGFVGITALTSLYGWANNQVEKEKANLDNLVREVQEENSDIDFDIPDARANRIEELRARAADAREAYDGWNKFWGEFGNVLRDEDYYLAQASALDTTPEMREAIEVFDQSTSLRTDIFKDYQAKLGKKTGPLRELFDSFNEYSNGAIEEIDGTLKLVAKGKDGKKNIAQRSLDAGDTEYLNTLATQLGLRNATELDLGFVEASLQSNSGAEILKLAKADPEAVSKYGQEAVDNAKAYVEYVYGVSKNSDKYAEEINGILEGLTAVTPLEEAKLDLEELTAAFDLGLIGLDEYAQRVGEQIEIIRKQIVAGDNTAATELELLKLQQQKAGLEKAISEAIVGRQENLRKIAEALGASDDDLNRATIEVGQQNLNNPNFTDNDLRLQTALDIIEAQKKLDLQLAYDSGNMAEVERIYNEGVKLTPEVRAVLFTSTLETNDLWQELLNDYEGFIDEFLTKMNGKEFADGVDSVLANAARNKNKEIFADFDGEALAEDVFGEVFDDVAGISDGLKSSLETQARNFASQLNNKDLSKEEREQLENALAFIVALMNFAGYSADAIAGALTGIPNADGSVVAGIIGANTDANNPLGTPPPANAKPSKEDQAKAQDQVAEAQFEYRRAVAQANSLELAQIDKEAADRERWRAETGEFETEEERQAAIWTAKANQVKAAFAERDAYKQLSDARFEYLQAIAQVNGDMIQVAQLEVQKLQSDLDMARATGDPNADAIAGQLLIAQDQLRRDLIESRGLDFELFAAYLEAEGDTVNAALTRVKQAQFVLDNARGPDETRQAQIELINAQQALRQAQQTERQSAYGLFAAEIAGEDPVAQAKVALALAQENLKDAKGNIEKADAQKAVIDAQRQLEDAMAQARYSMFSLRQAELAAMDDQIGAAQVAVEIARQQLNDAIAQGQGAAAINQARANLIQQEKALQDTMLNEKMDEYKWLLDMGQITQRQYIDYLQALQSTLAPGSKQFKELALTIKQLKDGIQGDLQANLPTSLTLPTLYEVRRFDQTGTATSGGASATGIGYQDNRQVTVSVQINNATEDTQGIVLKTLENTLGVGRNGYGERRY